MENKKPLYRKENKRALDYRHSMDPGGEFRHIRHTKKFKNFEGKYMGMKQGKQRGVDYTPLFHFLLSKVGQKWDQVHKEAVSRLDKEDPIYWMVAIYEKDKKAKIRVGENTMWSGLYVTDDGILEKVNPDLSINDLFPSCPCHTHTFNGKPLTNKWINPYKT